MPVTIDGTAGITYPAGTGVQSVGATLMTAVASTSGTSIDFTGIPAGVKRVTVMFNGVSTNGASIKLVQVGSGSVSTSGYISTSSNVSSVALTTSSTAGFVIYSNNASDVISGSIVLTLISGNTWVASHSVKAATTISVFGSGDISLGGALDRVRITTVNGTDTFDAGSINVLYE